MPRLFLGLELPEPVRDCLLAWRADVSGARWQRRDQLHLTLCFLGQLAPEVVPAVFRAMENMACEAFETRPVGARCFGNPDRPRTLWAEMESKEALTRLHDDIAGRIRDVGLPVEQRHFTPHVTLARFGRREAGPASAFLEQFGDRRAPAFSVDRISLFLSRTDDSGPRYQVIARFPLVEAPEPLEA